MPRVQRTVYVVGTESSGKTDLIRQLQAMSEGKLHAQPAHVFPTVGQEIVQINASSSVDSTAHRGGGSTVEVRELGGSVSSSWVSFIEKRLSRSETENGPDASQSQYALIFVIDAIAIHMVPAAVTAFQQLTNSASGVCREWQTLVVLQKSAMMGAMTCQETRVLLTGGQLETTETVQVVEIDTWACKGLDTVMSWIFSHS